MFSPSTAGRPCPCRSGKSDAGGDVGLGGSAPGAVVRRGVGLPVPGEAPACPPAGGGDLLARRSPVLASSPLSRRVGLHPHPPSSRAGVLLRHRLHPAVLLRRGRVLDD